MSTDPRDIARSVSMGARHTKGIAVRWSVVPTDADVQDPEALAALLYDSVPVGQFVLAWDSGNLYRKADLQKYADGGRMELFAVGAKAHRALEDRVAALEEALDGMNIPRNRP